VVGGIDWTWGELRGGGCFWKGGGVGGGGCSGV
jgi:hypothetical protein